VEIKEINEWVKHIESLHTGRIKEQKTDLDFYLDKYNIPIIEDEKYLIRTGYVAGMANGVTQQAIAYVPKVYVEGKNKTSQKGADKISSMGNKWLKQLSRQSVQPFRETFKKITFTDGEAWIYIAHNEELAMYEGDWRDVFPNHLPVHFIRYDPKIIFHDPAEEIDGKPRRILVKYMRKAGDIKASYPLWQGKKEYEAKDEVLFEYYIDKDTRYAVADSKPLFRNDEGGLANGDGRLSNIYGFVNMVHKYSGYGVDTQDRDPALLAFTRTRMIREKIIEDSSMATDFRYNMHELAWKIKDIIWPMDVPVPEDLLENYRRSPGTLNIIKMPTGGEPPKVEETQAFGAEAYAYRDRVRADLNAQYPLTIQGQAQGTSGRQEDILSNAGMAMYDSPIEANVLLWAEALDMGFKICSNEKLDLLPKGLSKDDCNSYSELTVDMTKDDLVARDRKINAGGIAVGNMQRSLRTHLILDYGMTAGEADDEIDEILAEQYMLKSPEIAAFLGAKAAGESGMKEELEAYTAATGQGEKLGSQIGTRGGEPRRGNVKTQTGREQADVSSSPYGVRSRRA